MIIKRILAVGVTILTLNLDLGLARFTSLEKNRDKEFLNFSVFLIFIISVPFICFVAAYKNTLSNLFFKSSDFNNLIVLTGFSVISMALFTITYAFFRGKQEMLKANKMQLASNIFPVVIIILMIAFYENEYLSLFLFVFLFSLFNIALAFYPIKNLINFSFINFIFSKISNYKKIFFFSVSRIPSGFLLSSIFAFPVFYASSSISLEAAGYIGIIISVVRLMEIFVTPFNLLLMPKFAELESRSNTENLTKKISIIMSLIVTVLPFLALYLTGLSKYIVILFFGSKYLFIQESLSIVILFSVFYLAYVLIRGILDGLFEFPYVNIICALGLVITCTCTLVFNDSIRSISLSLGYGLLFMGLASILILAYKTDYRLKINEVFESLIFSVLSFLAINLIDNFIESFYLNDFIVFSFKIILRLLLICIIYSYFWRYKIWMKELKIRISH